MVEKVNPYARAVDRQVLRSGDKLAAIARVAREPQQGTALIGRLPPAAGRAGRQPKGRTPISAAWPHIAKPAQATTPTATVTTVGTTRPGA